MTKAHIEGTVEVEQYPSEATIYFGERQIGIEYGGEVSTAELDEDGLVVPDGRNVAPGHNERILDQAIGLSELRNELHGIEL